MSSRSAPAVNKNAPIQSTFEAFGPSTERSALEGSFGMVKMAVTPMRNADPAMTKNTTFQFVYSLMMPPCECK